MKKITLTISVLLATLALNTGCKSNKQSMKNLYEQAVEQDAASAVQEVTPAPVTPAVPVTPATPSKPANDRTERVTVVNSSEAGLLKAYNIIVGTFGQLTNAEGMKNKMQSRGYNAFLVKNTAGMYRVVAAGYDTREQAEPVRDTLRANFPDEAGTCADAWLLIPQQ